MGKGPPGNPLGHLFSKVLHHHEPPRVCRYFQEGRACRDGNRCRFLHEVPPGSEADVQFFASTNDRVWSHQEATNSGNGFRVMAYNCLADDLVYTHAKELYPAVPRFCLKWSYRLELLLREIEYWSPDILCLQEIDHPLDFENFLKPRGYEGDYASRTGGRADGCLTAWRRDRFKLVESQTIQMKPLGLNDNVALLVVLRCVQEPSAHGGPLLDVPVNPAADPQGHNSERRSAPKVVVGNTHLLFNPRRGDVKVAQARVILTALQALADAHAGASCILTGDFNSTPNSAVYRFIQNGYLDCAAEDRRQMSGQLCASEEAWPPSWLRKTYQPQLQLGSALMRTLTGAVGNVFHLGHHQRHHSHPAEFHNASAPHPSVPPHVAGTAPAPAVPQQPGSPPSVFRPSRDPSLHPPPSAFETLSPAPSGTVPAGPAHLAQGVTGVSALPPGPPLPGHPAAPLQGGPPPGLHPPGAPVGPPRQFYGAGTGITASKSFVGAPLNGGSSLPASPAGTVHGGHLGNPHAESHHAGSHHPSVGSPGLAQANGPLRQAASFCGAQGLYTYRDVYGQQFVSPVPPGPASVKMPFYYDPMVVEEPEVEPEPERYGLPRTKSQHERQMNMGSWTPEQLIIAVGHAPGGEGQQERPRTLVREKGGVNSHNLVGNYMKREWVARHPLHVRSAYAAVLGEEPVYTSCHSKFIGTVDYIWYTEDSLSYGLKPRRVLLVPPLEVLHCGLPSPQWPSDHVSIVADFNFVEPGGSASSSYDSSGHGGLLGGSHHGVFNSWPRSGYPNSHIRFNS